MLSGVIEQILSIPPWAALVVVFALPALEASAFIGVLVPGEIAVLLGGVLAGQGRISLAAVLVAAVLGAVLGDQVGYVVGARYGERVLGRIPDRFLDAARLEKGQAFVRRLGVKAVIAGRWTASLRALVPGLCGMARMPYRRFAAANAVGGSLWAVTIVLAGYAAGDSWRRVQGALGTAGVVAAGTVVVLAVVVLVVRHLRGHKPVLEVVGEAIGERVADVLEGPSADPIDDPVDDSVDDDHPTLTGAT